MWLFGYLVTIGLLEEFCIVAFVIYVRPKRVWLFGYVWLFKARLFGDSTVSQYVKPSKQIWLIFFGIRSVFLRIFLEIFDLAWPWMTSIITFGGSRNLTSFDPKRPQVTSNSYKYSEAPYFVHPYFVKLPLFCTIFRFWNYKIRGAYYAFRI